MAKAYLTFRVDKAVKDAYMSLPREWKKVVRDYVSVAVLTVAREFKEHQQAQAPQAVQPAPPATPAQPTQPAQTTPQ